MRKLTKKERFSEKVLSKFNIYNSIFSTLPYESISDTGQLLPLFNEVCNNGYKQKKDPKYIVESFFNKSKHKLNPMNPEHPVTSIIYYL